MKPLTSGADEVVLQPACCLQAVLGVIESEVIGRDFLHVSLWPLTHDFTDICSCGSQGLEKWVGEWICGTDLGDTKTQWQSHFGYPTAAVLAHPHSLSHSAAANTPMATGNTDPTDQSAPVYVFPISCGTWVITSNSTASASGGTWKMPGTATPNSRNVPTHSRGSHQLSE